MNNTLEEEISFYLTHLNQMQKQAVLTVVKTFAQDYDEKEWINEEELNERIKEYENGTAKLLSLEELENTAKQAYQDKIAGKL